MGVFVEAGKPAQHSSAPPSIGAVVFERGDLDRLLATLRDRGYEVVGPTVRDGAIVYDGIRSTADLPEGWTDEQDAGRYRLRRRTDAALFGYAVGPHSWKRFLFPPTTTLWRSAVSGPSEAGRPEGASPRYAFLGVRACEIRAIEIQDKVFAHGPVRDEEYAARREAAFLIAVNCGAPAATCFCVSMGCGPRTERGYDIVLTEVTGPEGHYFVAEPGSERGAEVLADVSNRPANVAEQAVADGVVDRAAASMGRRVDAGAARLLAASPDAPRWDTVAERCLACGNCTMVCPTCFCSTVEDTTDLTGEHAERVRRWDSCFTADFSIMGGASVRSSTRARYRQWLTHKFSTWVDQFGTSGCVGCGRCIAWCPAGIDVTEEIVAITEEASP